MVAALAATENTMNLQITAVMGLARNSAVGRVELLRALTPVGVYHRAGRRPNPVAGYAKPVGGGRWVSQALYPSCRWSRARSNGCYDLRTTNTQFVSFDFLNPLIWAVASSALRAHPLLLAPAGMSKCGTSNVSR